MTFSGSRASTSASSRPTHSRNLMNLTAVGPSLRAKISSRARQEARRFAKQARLWANRARAGRVHRRRQTGTPRNRKRQAGSEAGKGRLIVANPLVSVVIPTYNRAYCLPETIDSALGQTYPNVEVVVADDGSTDETEAMMGQRYGSDARVRYVRQANSGSNVARNLGLRTARGDMNRAAGFGRHLPAVEGRAAGRLPAGGARRGDDLVRHGRSRSVRAHRAAVSAARLQQLPALHHAADLRVVAPAVRGGARSGGKGGRGAAVPRRHLRADGYGKTWCTRRRR
jgi:hypothetical protein